MSDIFWGLPKRSEELKKRTKGNCWFNLAAWKEQRENDKKELDAKCERRARARARKMEMDERAAPFFSAIGCLSKHTGSRCLLSAHCLWRTGCAYLEHYQDSCKDNKCAGSWSHTLTTSHSVYAAQCSDMAILADASPETLWQPGWWISWSPHSATCTHR